MNKRGELVSVITVAVVALLLSMGTFTYFKSSGIVQLSGESNTAYCGNGIVNNPAIGDRYDSSLPLETCDFFSNGKPIFLSGKNTCSKFVDGNSRPFSGGTLKCFVQGTSNQCTLDTGGCCNVICKPNKQVLDKHPLGETVVYVKNVPGRTDPINTVAKAEELCNYFTGKGTDCNLKTNDWVYQKMEYDTSPSSSFSTLSPRQRDSGLGSFCVQQSSDPSNPSCQTPAPTGGSSCSTPPTKSRCVLNENNFKKFFDAAKLKVAQDEAAATVDSGIVNSIKGRNKALDAEQKAKDAAEESERNLAAKQRLKTSEADLEQAKTALTNAQANLKNAQDDLQSKRAAANGASGKSEQDINDAMEKRVAGIYGQIDQLESQLSKSKNKPALQKQIDQLYVDAYNARADAQKQIDASKALGDAENNVKQKERDLTDAQNNVKQKEQALKDQQKVDADLAKAAADLAAKNAALDQKTNEADVAVKNYNDATDKLSNDMKQNSGEQQKFDEEENVWNHALRVAAGDVERTPNEDTLVGAGIGNSPSGSLSGLSRNRITNPLNIETGQGADTFKAEELKLRAKLLELCAKLEAQFGDLDNINSQICEKINLKTLSEGKVSVGYDIGGVLSLLPQTKAIPGAQEGYQRSKAGGLPYGAEDKNSKYNELLYLSLCTYVPAGQQTSEASNLPSYEQGGVCSSSEESDSQSGGAPYAKPA